MGKIFKITGTYYEGDEQRGHDFTGEIVTHKNNRFVGRIDQGYEFICGTFGYAVLLMSNQENTHPTFYLVNKVEGNKWTATQYTILGDHDDNRSLCRGAAEIQLEEIEFTKERAKELRAHYKQVDLDAIWNKGYTIRCFAERKPT